MMGERLFTPIQTLGDGNCGLNALALGLHDIITSQTFPALDPHKQAKILSLVGPVSPAVGQGGETDSLANASSRFRPSHVSPNPELTANWSHFIMALQGLRGSHIQTYIAKLLRELLYSLIKDQDTPAARYIYSGQRFIAFSDHVKKSFFHLSRGEAKIPTDYPEFAEISELNNQIKTLYEQFITEKQQQFQTLTAPSLEQQAQHQALNHVIRILQQNAITENRTDETRIHAFFDQIDNALRANWNDFYLNHIANHIRQNGRWVSVHDLTLLTDYLSLSLRISDETGRVIFSAYNAKPYPDSFIRYLLAEAEPVAIQQRRQQQRLWLKRYNLISEDGDTYCQLESSPDDQFMHKIRSLSNTELFQDFDFEWLVRLNFIHNKPLTQIHCINSQDHWTYCRPTRGYVTNATLLPKTLQYVKPTLGVLDFTQHPDFHEAIRDFYKNDPPSGRRCAESCHRLYDAYGDAIADDETILMTPKTASPSQGGPRPSSRDIPALLEATYDALYITLLNSDETPVDLELAIFLLHKNPLYASYHFTQTNGKRWTLLHKALMSPTFPFKLIDAIQASNPTALTQNMLTPLAGQAMQPNAISALHMTLNRNDCNLKMVQHLIQAGAPVGGYNADGRSTLEVAIAKGQLDIAIELLAHHKRPGITNDALPPVRNPEMNERLVRDLYRKAHQFLLKTDPQNRRKTLYQAIRQLMNHIEQLRQQTLQLDPSDTSKVAAIELVQGLSREVAQLCKNPKAPTQKEMRAFIQQVQATVQANLAKIRKNQPIWIKVLNVLLALTVVGAVLRFGYFTYQKYWQQKPVAFLFQSPLLSAGDDLRRDLLLLESNLPLLYQHNDRVPHFESTNDHVNDSDSDHSSHSNSDSENEDAQTHLVTARS